MFLKFLMSAKMLNQILVMMETGGGAERVGPA